MDVTRWLFAVFAVVLLPILMLAVAGWLMERLGEDAPPPPPGDYEMGAWDNSIF